MIGMTFILQSDAVSYKYFNKGQTRQQMLFYAAGILEAYIEGVEPHASEAPFNRFDVQVITTDNVRGNPRLQMIQVIVRDPNSDVEPVTLYTYRVKFND